MKPLVYYDQTNIEVHYTEAIRKHWFKITQGDTATVKEKDIHAILRPAIKENTACVVAACQSNILLLRRVISVKLNIGKKIIGLDIMTLISDKF